MIKIILASFLSFQILSAGLVDAIALKVNDDIVTLYDIDEKMQVLKVSKEQAVNMIVDELLFKQELKNNNISVNSTDINNYLQNVAKSNNMTIDQFKAAVSAQQNYDVYEDSVKQKIAKYKLSQKVLRGELKQATTEDMKIYYDNNQELFEVAKELKTIRYESKNQQDLVKVTQNPMFTSASIKKVEETINLETSNNQIKYLFSGVKQNGFTKIAKYNDGFVIYYVTQKEGVSLISFEQVKEKIFNVLMKDREEKFLKEYFNSLRLKSNIEVLR
jgi:parvulin-like peptidyl-prolyl isomerase